MTQVRQTQSEKLVDRPIVRLNVKIADYSAATEFNLIDRHRMQYPLLVGRTLLTDIFVVECLFQEAMFKNVLIQLLS